MEEEIEVAEQRPSSMRRTLTMRNNAARQVAVNFMPSRQLPYNTLRLRRNNSEHNALLEEIVDVDAPDAVEKQADIIVREMEQHQRLMEDNPVSEELRREALRDLPQGLTMKRNVRAKLSASVSLRSKRRPISVLKRLKYRISFAFKRTRDRVRDLIFSVELWYEAIRNIEGHFGSAVGSYFYFLRWLFALDLAFATLIIAFVVIPQALHDNARNGTVDRSFMDFISGQGTFADSLLFYGHYHDEDIETRGPLTYNMPFAYFFTMVCLYLMFFAVLCFRTAYSYRRNFIETAGGLSHVYANKVFCGWDFGIVSGQAAALNATSIYSEFKELLSEQNKKRVTRSLCATVWRYCTNTLVTLLVAGGIAATQWALWRVLARAAAERRAVAAGAGAGAGAAGAGATGAGAGVLGIGAIRHWDLLVSLAVTAVVTLFPVLLHLVVRLEFYKPRTAFYVTLARTWLLDVGTLLLLLVFWTTSQEDCWETSFGQETYRLVLLDSLVSLFLLPVLEFVRAFLYKLNPSGNAPEFNITYNSLTLIYNQGVLWFGAMFSPLLPVAVTLKLLLLFYVKRACALRACRPASKVWRAAQTQTVLYMLVTMSLFATLFGIGSMFFRTSSQICGPFRSHNHVYEVVSEGVLQLSQHQTARGVLAFVTKPGVIAFLVLFLCVCVYYMRAKALAQRSMVRILRHMLVLQAKDKDFLLTAITKVSNGEWLYSPKPSEDEGPESHTWKYLQEVRKPSNAGYHFDASRLSHSLIEGRPRSYVRENRPNSNYTEKPKSNEDGDTDSSFSWQGSSNYLNQRGEVEPDKKWI